ncbi:hypothetical protein GEMHA0001_0519 [Gemella haemolysans ATCC 10379]|uniref:Uncharacterized protein n=1 Tax=Gemella haemolysans ATCC 10379 TaxID=546270 RepID=C5NYH9_9BACL|nr:hypothetical protein GEMHA0001_0519 [Gemella haemolysans ATCC 10379]
MIRVIDIKEYILENLGLLDQLLLLFIIIWILTLKTYNK